MQGRNLRQRFPVRSWLRHLAAAMGLVHRDSTRDGQAEVLAAARDMPREAALWHKSGADPHAPGGLYAFQRLREPYFIPYAGNSFKLAKSDAVFAIGSCFARGIESALKVRGFRVESAATDFDQFPVVGDRKVTALGFTNKYTVHSILNEFRWALDPAAHFPQESLVDMDGGHCVDPHINPTLQATDRAGTLERRRIIREVNARVSHCRAVLLTLERVEGWYDVEAGVHLNTTPSRGMKQLFPGRYRPVTSNHHETLQALEGVHALLTAHGHPDFRIVVTTSPIPLQATHSGRDVVVANAYSKATLRAASQDFASAHPNVEYFPSYEMVVNSERDLAWEEDLKHVKGLMTNRIMDLFMHSFVAGDHG